MKREKITELLGKKNVVRAGSILLSSIVLGTGAWAVDQNMGSSIPELTTFVDMDEQISIEEEEVPLASAPKVTVKTTKTKKVVKLKKKATKTSVKKKKATKKTKTKTKTTSSEKTTTKTETTTYVTEKYKKGSKKKTVLTTKKIKTTVTTLELAAAGASNSKSTAVVSNTTASKKQNTTVNTTASSGQKTTAVQTAANQQTTAVQTVASQQSTGVSTSKAAQTTVSTTTSAKQEAVSGEIAVSTAAPKVDSRVKNAYESLGFKIIVDSSVSYSGYFSARNQSITLRKNDDTVYHELGHFLAFVAGNVDTKADFKAVYQEEKDLFVGIRKAYATQNSSEYFAESFREYTLDPITLKNSRPKTYQSIEDALSKVTEEQVSMILRYYSALWN